MSVFLASSEFAEPRRVRELGFESGHFTASVLVPEVPPKAMLELLQAKWRMGPSLAKGFVSVWGGACHQ